MNDLRDAGLVDRARGCLVGLAVGDALGTTLEFATRDTAPRHTEMTGGGTSMALALADSLVQRHGFEAAVVLAINLADDADTVGAVTGQLAGAVYGMAAISPRWTERLAWRQRLVTAADELLSGRN